MRAIFLFAKAHAAGLPVFINMQLPPKGILPASVGKEIDRCFVLFCFCFLRAGLLSSFDIMFHMFCVLQDYPSVTGAGMTMSPSYYVDASSVMLSLSSLETHAYALGLCTRKNASRYLTYRTTYPVMSKTRDSGLFRQKNQGTD